MKDYNEGSSFGRYLRDLDKRETPLVTKQDLVVDNLAFVINRAKRFVRPGVLLTDLIQVGNIGLMKAAERYDPNRDNKFLSYAKWWIIQEMQIEVASYQRPFSVKVSADRDISKLNRLYGSFSQYHGREPTLEEMAAAMEKSVDRIKELRKVMVKCVSLDHPPQSHSHEGDEGSSLRNYIPDTTARSMDDYAQQRGLEREVKRILKRLGPKERKIVRLRFGLSGRSRDRGRDKTLKETGREVSLTNERVRQIQDEVIKRLRNGKTERLRQFYDEMYQ